MKKESKAAHVYPNNDIYRKENVQSPHIVAAKSNATYNRSNNNNNQYQNQTKMKNQSMVMQEGYFPGFYAKHPPPPPNIHHQANDVMFAKHELEFHQKSLTNPQQQQQQQQFPPFPAATKYDMHEYEQHHNILKNDVNHKGASGNNVVHRPLDFPQNQMYYNENNAQNSSTQNQYYPNEFDIGNDGAGSIGGGAATAGYFDPKSQAHYYHDMNYHHHSGGNGGGGNDYPELYGPNAIVNENCENFASFQQYYDHHQQQQQQQTQQQQNMHHPHHYSHPHHQNITNPTNAYVHHQHQQQQQNFQAQMHGNTNLTAENSNSSSDFNFLSNLNDFAPEYYQLS